eukprot:359632-Chlamydomonas_euryale.AAC.3
MVFARLPAPLCEPRPPAPPASSPCRPPPVPVPALCPHTLPNIAVPMLRTCSSLRTASACSARIVACRLASTHRRQNASVDSSGPPPCASRSRSHAASLTRFMSRTREGSSAPWRHSSVSFGTGGGGASALAHSSSHAEGSQRPPPATASSLPAATGAMASTSRMVARRRSARDSTSWRLLWNSAARSLAAADSATTCAAAAGGSCCSDAGAGASVKPLRR